MGYSKPKAFRGAIVIAKPHRGGVARGKVAGVETHYGWTSNEPYHVYRVVFGTSKRGQWLGDEDILSVEEASP